MPDEPNMSSYQIPPKTELDFKVERKRKVANKISTTQTLFKNTKKTFQFFFLIMLPVFSNLRRQVVAFHSGRADPFIRCQFIFACLFLVARFLAASLAMYLRLSAYLCLDFSFRSIYYQRTYFSAHFTTLMISMFFVLFNVRLFGLLYYRCPDPVVWSHLYELLVRLVGSSSNRLQEKRTLHYYSFLENKNRRWCARVTILAEVVFTIAMLIFGLIFFQNLFFWHDLIWRRGTVLQQAFLATIQLCFAQVYYRVFVQLFLVLLVHYVVCHVYTDQYRRVVNKNLRKVLNRLLTHRTAQRNQNLKFLNSLALSRATASYRALHTRLTAFILRYNESIVSQVIVYFVHYVVPVHGFFIVKLYLKCVQSETYAAFLADNKINLFLELLFFLAFLVITLFTARVNDQIVRSGQILGSIFPRKSMMMMRAHCRRQTSYNNWVSNFNAIWSREAVRLSAYYELVWRAEKQLAFTAGQNNAPLEWKYISEVRRVRGV